MVEFDRKMSCLKRIRGYDTGEEREVEVGTVSLANYIASKLLSYF